MQHCHRSPTPRRWTMWRTGGTFCRWRCWSSSARSAGQILARRGSTSRLSWPSCRAPAPRSCMSVRSRLCPCQMPLRPSQPPPTATARCWSARATTTSSSLCWTDCRCAYLLTPRIMPPSQTVTNLLGLKQLQFHRLACGLTISTWQGLCLQVRFAAVHKF